MGIAGDIAGWPVDWTAGVNRSMAGVNREPLPWHPQAAVAAEDDAGEGQAARRRRSRRARRGWAPRKNPSALEVN
jgi:hypothetical protein